MFGYVVVTEIDATALSPVGDALLRYRQGLGAGGQSSLDPNALAVDLIQSVLELAQFGVEFRLPKVDVSNTLTKSVIKVKVKVKPTATLLRGTSQKSHIFMLRILCMRERERAKQ